MTSKNIGATEVLDRGDDYDSDKEIIFNRFFFFLSKELCNFTEAIPERVDPGARGAVLWGPFWASSEICPHI